jgi:hypothetical protein
VKRTKPGYYLALLAAFVPLYRYQSKRVAVAAGKATGAERAATRDLASAPAILVEIESCMIAVRVVMSSRCG